MMSRYAEIRDGVVINVVKADLTFAARNGLIAAEVAQLGWSYEDGKFAPPPQQPRNLEDVRTNIRAQVKAAYSQAMQPIAEAYPPEEREGWAEQVTAAQEVLSGGQNDLIDALRAPTGETAMEMAQKIIGLRQQYIIAYGQVTAARRGVTAQIESATTLTELDAIDVNAAFGLTG